MVRKLIFPTVIILFFAFFPLSASNHNHECTAHFLDGLFLSQKKEHNIAGISFAMTAGDTIDIEKYYGWAQIGAGEMVDDKTGFSIGSVSKLFIWVAVMQLYEEGLLDLDSNINQYLNDFRIPEKYESISMNHLMTHTPGFEDGMHVFSYSHERLPTLETYLLENLPRQIYSPGEIPAYSNYGSALAAYVVEQITQMDFNDYVETHIFTPLGMHHTTFRQPAAFSISDKQAQGYYFYNGVFRNPFNEYIIPYPAGSAVSSGSDMKKFMMVLLDKGYIETTEEGKEVRLLQEETIEKMLSLTHQHHPKSDGMAHGFMRMQYRGLEVLFHGGNTLLFHTVFAIIPEHNIGMFFSINTGETLFNHNRQMYLILDHIFANTPTLEPTFRTNGLNEYKGSFKMSRKIESNYLKILSLFMRIHISPQDEGLLVNMGHETRFYRPKERDVFSDGQSNLIFIRSENDNIKSVMFSEIPVIIFQKPSFREGLHFNAFILMVSLIICLRSIFSLMVYFFKGDRKRNQPFRWTMFIHSLLVFAFFIMLLGVINSPEKIIFEAPPWLFIVLFIPILSLVLFVVSLYFWFDKRSWSKQAISRTFWQFFSFVFLVFFYIQMYYWKLLSIPA